MHVLYDGWMVKKALIVDDVPFDVELTRRVLQACSRDHEIVAVSDGEEALRELNKEHSFDVVLLDLKLPKVDGFEVLKEISSKPFLSDIPVIVLSSSRNEADRMRTRVLGAGDFVEKAIDYAVFEADLTRALAQFGFGAA
jgi:CheY-like chemotaxis protein